MKLYGLIPQARARTAVLSGSQVANNEREDSGETSDSSKEQKKQQI